MDRPRLKTIREPKILDRANQKLPHGRVKVKGKLKHPFLLCQKKGS